MARLRTLASSSPTRGAWSSLFSLYVAGDAYSTAQKIMGRQSAGASLLRGIFRYSDATLVAACANESAQFELSQQAKSSGYTGNLQTDLLPSLENSQALGAIYYPAPPIKDLAHLRNSLGSHSASIFGVTHTISSKGVLEQVGDMVLPPFKPWDALICTSRAAKTLVECFHEEMKGYWAEALGATRFVQPELPVIPLGVNVHEFSDARTQREEMRQKFGILESDVVLLFVGRLAFHAKANPLGLYAVLGEVSRQFFLKPGGPRVVVVEAGIYPNEPVRNAYRTAQRELCPEVRFIHIDGNAAQDFQEVWSLADVFVSLSDNIQETFGITPVEAMACGLPVVVSDWDGYKDTVRHGVDGFRISTILPQPGAGEDLALRYGLDVDTYDMYIGRVSLATVVDLGELRKALTTLIENEALRIEMGRNAFSRASLEYDWLHVLEKYNDLVRELRSKRMSAVSGASEPHWPLRADPFARFSHFSTSVLSQSSQDRFVSAEHAARRFTSFKALAIANYGFKEGVSDVSLLDEVFRLVNSAKGGIDLQDTLAHFFPAQKTQAMRALMWLWKFGVISKVER